MSKALPSFDYVSSRLEYSSETGIATWRYWPDAPRQWNVRYAGEPAGFPHRDGHMYAGFGRRLFPLHRLIWLLITGQDPGQLEVDHVNGVGTDNRRSNLRLASRVQNHANSRARGRWPKGVYRNQRGTFIAQIKVNGVNHYLGSFETAAKANACYADWAAVAFGEFACSHR